MDHVPFVLQGTYAGIQGKLIPLPVDSGGLSGVVSGDVSGVASGVGAGVPPGVFSGVGSGVPSGVGTGVSMGTITSPGVSDGGITDIPGVGFGSVGAGVVPGTLLVVRGVQAHSRGTPGRQSTKVSFS